MRHNQSQNLMAGLQNQIKAALSDDERVNAVLRHGQQAAAYSVRQDWRRAAAEYEKIAALSAEIGDGASEALGHYGQGMSLQKLGKQSETVRQAYQRAATLAEQVGHHALAAKSHHLLASLHLDKKDLAGAIEELTLALQHIKKVNEPGLTVLIHRTRASVYTMHSQFDPALADLNSALVIAQQSGDSNLVQAIELDRQGLQEAAQFEHILSDLNLVSDDLLETMEQAMADIARRTPEDSPEKTVHMARLRASSHLLRGQLDQALTELDQALAAAQQMKDESTLKAIESERQRVQELQQMLGNSVDSIDLKKPFESLLALVYPTEQQQIAGDSHLHQAHQLFEAGNLAEALKQAETAQQMALTSIEPARYNRYLLASLLIAEIKEQLDDKPGVLFALLTCKGTLEQALGPESSHLVTLFLDSLHQRWGPKTLQEALQGYRQQVQEKVNQVNQDNAQNS
jgi:tetratricopeptide (TPR) repeat protein